jgi:hypothetical protein
MQKIILLFLALLFVPAVFVSWHHSAAMELKNDSQTIADISKPLLQGDYNFIIKWSGTIVGYASMDSFSMYFNQLSDKLDMHSIGKLESVNNLPVLRASSSLTNGVQLQSMLVGSKDQKTSIFILKLSADAQSAFEQMVKFQLELQYKLDSLGLNGSWNTTVQGSLIHSELANQPEVLLRSLIKDIQGQEQELYEDGNTISISILSKKLQASVQSGNHNVNLQIALHQNSITKAWRVTIGSPLITMEY